jgi:amino-acid N-acetyltransferase
VLIQITDRWTPAERAGTASGQPLVARALTGAPSSAAPAAIQIRAARIGDMRQVEPLIRVFANDNVMLPKTFDQLARTFREFVVAEGADGRIVGCGALRIYNEGLAEICSLAIEPAFQGLGIGRRVVERLIEDARTLDVNTVFALTLKPEFFGHLGFRIVPKEDFPLKVWADCRSCPKLHACDEIAVAMDLATDSALNASAGDVASRPLRDETGVAALKAGAGVPGRTGKSVEIATD